MACIALRDLGVLCKGVATVQRFCIYSSSDTCVLKFVVGTEFHALLLVGRGDLESLSAAMLAQGPLLHEI